MSDRTAEGRYETTGFRVEGVVIGIHKPRDLQKEGEVAGEKERGLHNVDGPGSCTQNIVGKNIMHDLAPRLTV